MRKNKRPSFFRTIIDAIKKAKIIYKNQITEEVNKHRLLSSHSDWSMIETFVQKCNQNPDLNVIIKLNDGTTLQLNTYKPKALTIDQRLNEITVEENY